MDSDTGKVLTMQSQCGILDAIKAKCNDLKPETFVVEAKERCEVQLTSRKYPEESDLEVILGSRHGFVSGL